MSPSAASPVGVRGARGRHVVGAVVEHRQREAEPERGLKVPRIRRDRAGERLARLDRIAALGEHDAQLKPLLRGRLELDCAEVELGGLVEAALPLQKPGESDQRDTQIGVQPYRRAQRGFGSGLVPEVAQQEPERRMATGVVGLQPQARSGSRRRPPQVARHCAARTRGCSTRAHNRASPRRPVAGWRWHLRCRRNPPAAGRDTPWASA